MKNMLVILKALSDSNKVYNEQCDKLEGLHEKGEVFVISSSVPVNVGRFEGDLDTLRKLYELGYNDVKNNLTALKNI